MEYYLKIPTNFCVKNKSSIIIIISPLILYYVLSPIGPVVGACTDLVDTRYLGITGGILSGLGIITASFASHIEIMIVCISIINGTSFFIFCNSLSSSNCLLYNFFEQ